MVGESFATADATERLRRATRVSPTECVEANASDATAWDSFVRSHPDASGYHQWGWRTVFATGLGHRCHYLFARRGDAVVGVLPLVEVRSRLFGHALSSLPYVNYGGVVARDEAAAMALVERASALTRSAGLSYLVLRHRKRALPDLPARNHKVTMLLRLAGSRQAMWEGLDRKVRNQVRKAEKSHLTVVSGGAELLDEFHTVFARNMRDLGTPVYGRSLFAAILAQFPGDARLHVVRLNGRTIAGALSYAYGEWVEVPSASSLREHRALCPGHLMYWSIMEQAIAEQRTVFDFGRSAPDDGTYHFKEQWGAVPKQLWWEYSLQGQNAVPVDDRHSAKFQVVIEAWKRLPVGLANAIGPHIARLVP